MRILADLHVAPRTVEFLRRIGHDVLRVSEVMDARSPDEAVVAAAAQQDRVVLTQDLDFSEIIALSGQTRPSLIILRLGSSRVEYVQATLARASCPDWSRWSPAA